jgi:hypothetical protein
MTVAEAKGLTHGAYVHLHDRFNADGTCMRARVTSVKTWKTREDAVEVHVKHGLYDYAVFSAGTAVCTVDSNVSRLYRGEECDACPERVSAAKCTFFPCDVAAVGKYRGNALCTEHLEYAEAIGGAGPGTADRGPRYWINRFYGRSAQYDPSDVVGACVTLEEVEKVTGKRFPNVGRGTK